MGSLSDKDIIGGLGIGKEMMQMPIPKIVDGFEIGLLEAKVEATQNTPEQDIVNLRHLQTGVDCYLTRDPGVKIADAELAVEAKNVLMKLAAESQQFSQINFTDELAIIHQCIGKYVSAPDAQSLAGLRMEFSQLANHFPQIPENLRQIDLAATWEWQVKQVFKKKTEPLIEYKSTPGVEMSDITPPSIVMMPTEHKNFDK